eukprot:15454810-Alexandrium_andersonii.AAC.1
MYFVQHLGVPGHTAHRMCFRCKSDRNVEALNPFDFRPGCGWMSALISLRDEEAEPLQNPIFALCPGMSRFNIELDVLHVCDAGGGHEPLSGKLLV